MYKYYNINQICLPMNLAIELKENDIAFAVNEIVENIPDENFTYFNNSRGASKYPPKMMLKLILCAYTQSVFSGRKIEELTYDSIRIRWLTQNYKPSYKTINNFRVDRVASELLAKCYIEFHNKLIEEGLIDKDNIYIDGTKIEANANKFTFVWKKSINKYHENLKEKSIKAYKELVEKEIIPEIEVENEELSVKNLKEIEKYLKEKEEELTKEIETEENVEKRKEKRKERTQERKVKKEIRDYKERKEKYIKALEILGERNSYSKTDPEATFMRMKEDYMGNGQLKAGYNLQIGTNNQYVIEYEVYQNPTDTRTLPKFIEKMEKSIGIRKNIIADAGYGSEENYEIIIEKYNKTALIPYNMYEKEKTRKYKKNKYNPRNWKYNEIEDSYICEEGKKLKYKEERIKKNNSGYKSKVKIYECEECIECKNKEICTRAKGNKKIQRNNRYEKYKEYIKNKLSMKKTREIYKKRKTDVEPVFGNLKANLGFRRFSVRGKEKVRNEIGFALMALNIKKYAKELERRRKNIGEKKNIITENIKIVA